MRLSGLTRLTAVVLVDQALLDHLDGDPDGGGAGPLAGAGLEHVERAVLHRELDVLHLLVVRLELLADAHELLVDLGHLVVRAG